MPSVSKSQQRFMGLVHAYKKGEVPASQVSQAVKDAAKSMKKKSTKKFASTKHDDLPDKVREYVVSENPAAAAASPASTSRALSARSRRSRPSRTCPRS